MDFLASSGDFSVCFVRDCSGDCIGADTGATTVLPAEEESAEAAGAAEESFRTCMGELSDGLSAGRRTIGAGGAGARDSNCMLNNNFPSAKSLSAITLLCSVNHLKSSDKNLGKVVENADTQGFFTYRSTILPGKKKTGATLISVVARHVSKNLQCNCLV